MTDFQLSYDYRCPFANIVHQHVIEALRAGADFGVTFVPWTMSQGYRDPGALDVWDEPARDEELLALAVSTSIRDQQPEYFLDAHEALFRARHQGGVRLVSAEQIAGVLAHTGVDVRAALEDVATRRPHKVIGECFREFEGYDAFGVPTFVVGGDATFVRYLEPPTADGQASIRIIHSLLELMTSGIALNEFKHTKVPF